VSISREAEYLVLTLTGAQHRVVAIVPVDGGCAPGPGLDVAQAAARIGKKVLFLDLYGLADTDQNEGIWSPVVEPGQNLDPIVCETGLHILHATARRDHVVSFSNVERLKSRIESEFHAYDLVIIGTAGLLDASVDHPNPLATAAAADGCVVVAQPYRTTRRQLNRASEDLAKAGAKVVGSVADDRHVILPGPAIAASVQKWLWFAPRFSRRMARAARSISILN